MSCPLRNQSAAVCAWRIAQRGLRLKRWADEPWAVVYDSALGDCFLVDTVAASVLERLLQAPATGLTDAQLLADASGLSDDAAEDALKRLSKAGLIEKCRH